jgi:hypothetical protein
MPTPSQSSLDHNAALHAPRSCHACGAAYSADEVQTDPGWEPTRNGWRCGACSRARRGEVRERALELIASTDPSWTLVLSSPAHGSTFDDCLKCEALIAASEMLLERGGLLTRDEASALAEAVIAGRDSLR